MQIFKNYSLKKHNTFAINAFADYFVAPKSVEDLKGLLNDKQFMKKEPYVLGGGSNLLFTRDLDKLIIHPDIKGLNIEGKLQSDIIVKVAAGEQWDSFVQWAVDKGLCGVENLSLIPGCVGAAPVQNIGAYGVELKDVLYKVEALNMESGTIKLFTKDECEFTYRNSVFKNKLKGKYIITHVYFKLSENQNFKLDYGNLKSELQKFDKVNLQNIRRAVINIRRSKLPEPEELPNAGSFFKNPVISEYKFAQLKLKFPEIVYYPAGSGKLKLAAGWLIDYCGLKGYRQDDAGVHKKQALVLVNYGNATGKDILNLAEYVRTKVFNTFGIHLDFEVNIL
jgi:UDP-N-acetylmuramate dehydrogenase